MTKHLLYVGVAATLGAVQPLEGQCTVHQNDLDIGIPLVSRGAKQQTSYGTASASNLPISAADCGASPNKADQTSAIQAAINASCGLATNNTSPPPVYIPPGQYLIVNLKIGCSGLVLYGAGSGGARGGLGGTRLCSFKSAAPMLTVGTPSAPLARVTLQDLQFSGYCGTTFPP